MRNKSRLASAMINLLNTSARGFELPLASNWAQLRSSKARLALKRRTLRNLGALRAEQFHGRPNCWSLTSCSQLNEQSAASAARYNFRRFNEPDPRPAELLLLLLLSIPILLAASCCRARESSGEMVALGQPLVVGRVGRWANRVECECQTRTRPDFISFACQRRLW